MACSTGLKMERLCLTCRCWAIPWDVGLDAECQGCHDGTHSFMICQTKRQRHCNHMLFMRRTMKSIAQAMRVEKWQLWMDNDPAVGELEPELLDEDLDAYLRAAGHTEESIAESLAKIMKILEDAKERYKGG